MSCHTCSSKPSGAQTSSHRRCINSSSRSQPAALARASCGPPPLSSAAISAAERHALNSAPMASTRQATRLRLWSGWLRMRSVHSSAPPSGCPLSSSTSASATRKTCRQPTPSSSTALKWRCWMTRRSTRTAMSRSSRPIPGRTQRRSWSAILAAPSETKRGRYARSGCSS
eukprot:2367007-Prymnesium_polylepis.3